MKKVCIDAGHFAKYNRSPVVPEYWESERMWKLAELLAAALKKKGVSVVKTRTDQAKDLALTSRGKKAQGCDLFISIHSNAASSESVDYPVSMVYGGKTKLDQQSDDIGLKLAKVVEAQMGTVQKARTMKKLNSSGGEWYGVLRGAKAVDVPGVILEHSFHTNTKATNWLLSDSNLEKMAEAEAECIVSWLNQTTETTSTTKPTTAQKVDSAMGFTKSYAKSYTVSASGLNMRYGAGTTKAVVKVLRRGAKFTCYGYFTKVNGTVWLLGVDSTGATGFCSKDFLK